MNIQNALRFISIRRRRHAGSSHLPCCWVFPLLVRILPRGPLFHSLSDIRSARRAGILGRFYALEMVGWYLVLESLAHRSLPEKAALAHLMGPWRISSGVCHRRWNSRFRSGKKGYSGRQGRHLYRSDSVHIHSRSDPSKTRIRIRLADGDRNGRISIHGRGHSQGYRSFDRGFQGQQVIAVEAAP